MPALVAGIHVFFAHPIEDVDARAKPTHDGVNSDAIKWATALAPRMFTKWAHLEIIAIKGVESDAWKPACA
jgi:hypothetical protein